MPYYDSLTISILFFTLIFGLITCFFGYRILRFLLAVTGFILGAALAVAIVLAFMEGSILSLNKGSDFLLIIGAGIIGGLILSVILLFLYSAGIFILGMLFGLFLFIGVFALFHFQIEPVLYVIPALIFGLMTLFLQKFMIILMTSGIGSWLLVLTILYGMSANFDPSETEFLNNLGDIEIYRLILGWIALFGLGVITQYFIFPKKTADLEPQANESDSDIDT